MAESTVEFEDNTIKVLNALDNAYITWLYEAAGELEAQAKRNTKVGKISAARLKANGNMRSMKAPKKLLSATRKRLRFGLNSVLANMP